MNIDNRLIDVSHTLKHGQVTYKGLPAPAIRDFSAGRPLEPGTPPVPNSTSARSRWSAGNTGVDSPFHRYPHRKDLAALPLESLANVNCGVARIPFGRTAAIDRLPLREQDARGRAVLVQTDWDRHGGTDQYFEGHPHLTGESAQWLVRAGARLVGIDSLNIDGVATGERPVHSILLRQDVPIVEHLRGLAALPERRSRFFAVPANVKAFGIFPVRAFALV